MLQYSSQQTSPSLDELIDSDDTPVDNEDQNLIPNLLLTTLLLLWADRFDWFFAVDMLIRHSYQGEPNHAIVPDAFLALGIPRRPDPSGRRSYQLAYEKQVPQFILEMVSKDYNQEYEDKMNEYAAMGALYYGIYLPPPLKRSNHDVLEVYKLGPSGYERVPGDPVWMPEIGLGIGTGTLPIGGVQLACLLWHDESGDLYYPPEVEVSRMLRQLEQERQRVIQAEQEREQERQRASQAEQEREQERQRASQAEQERDQLRERLRALGLDPDTL